MHLAGMGTPLAHPPQTSKARVAALLACRPVRPELATGKAKAIKSQPDKRNGIVFCRRSWLGTNHYCPGHDGLSSGKSRTTKACYQPFLQVRSTPRGATADLPRHFRILLDSTRQLQAQIAAGLIRRNEKA